MGLSIARRLVKMYAGRSEARSAGQGMDSEFTVRMLGAGEQLPRKEKVGGRHA